MDAARYFRRNAVVVFLGYTLFTALLFFYVCRASIPDQLNHVQGTLHVVRVAKNDKLLSFDRDNGLLLTCASSYRGYTSCISDKDLPGVVGRPAEATWFPLQVFPFYSVNRLATLKVDGREVINLEDTQRRMSSSMRSLIWSSGSVGLLVVGICLFLWRLASRAERRKAANA